MIKLTAICVCKILLPFKETPEIRQEHETLYVLYCVCVCVCVCLLLKQHKDL